MPTLPTFNTNIVDVYWSEAPASPYLINFKHSRIFGEFIFRISLISCLASFNQIWGKGKITSGLSTHLLIINGVSSIIEMLCLNNVSKLWKDQMYILHIQIIIFKAPVLNVCSNEQIYLTRSFKNTGFGHSIYSNLSFTSPFCHDALISGQIPTLKCLIFI